MESNNRFLPEGSLLETPQNLAAIRSESGLREASATGQRVEAYVTVCDSAHNLHVDLPCMRGIIPRSEGAVGIQEGTTRDIALISLIAPTSEQRIAMIAGEAEGFIYLVSSLGVTGTRSEITTDLSAVTRAIRENAHVPFAIGFGISTPAQARAMADLSDGAIIGSAIVKIMAKYGKDAPPYVEEFVRSMKDALK